MTTKNNLEEKLEELGRAIGSDESLAESVIGHIDAKPIGEPDRIRRRFTMRRLTKLAAAAVIILAVLIGIHRFRGPIELATAAWGDVINALNATNDVHFVMEWTLVNGETGRREAWLKNKVMLRDELPSRIIIDDAVNRLILDQEEKTAQLMDSFAPFEDYMSEGMFELLRLFRGEERETPYEATELPDESSSKVQVYEVTRRGGPYGKVWVDSQSILPIKIVSTESSKRVSRWEAVFDYNPIPEEAFDLTIPPDYVQLPRRERPSVSGSVVDEEGKPVADAEVYVPWREAGLWGQTDENGDFVIKLPPYARRLPELPIVLRALMRNDPYRVAWTFAMNPEDKREGNYYEGYHAEGLIRDEKVLFTDIGGEPGEIVFQEIDDSRVPFGLRGVLLQMGPATVISGRVTDEAGKPVANAKVWVDRVRIQFGKGRNKVYIRTTGDLSGEDKACAFTDANGHYELTSIINPWRHELADTEEVWSRIDLEIEGDGYTESKSLFQQQRCDFNLWTSRVVIRGQVIDDLGLPLAFREVGVEFQGKDLDGDGDPDEEKDLDIDGTMTDPQGRFELLNIPRISGLAVGVESDRRPHDWDEIDETRNLEFRHYLETHVPVDFEPGRNEYWIEIIPQRPDITIEVEVKDSEGRPLAGIPVGVSSFNSGKAEWFITKLTGISNEYGICTISQVPRDESLELWISQPVACGGFDWYERRGIISAEFSEAVAASRRAYAGRRLRINLEPERKEYKVSVTLKRHDE